MANLPHISNMNVIHNPHGSYGYHIHLGGKKGQKLDELHLQVTKSVWEFLKKLFG